ncbi:hypothetical protein HDU92_000502 [Lobulomyces angularis]|nr:hypothetical protein HDU92_000502 [Lobulomyces angularis]
MNSKAPYKKNFELSSTTLTSIPLENTIPLDPTLVSDVELCAKEIEASINSLTTNLTKSLDEMTNSTKKFVQVQNLSVNNLNLEIDTSIEQTLSLINKVDELTHDMDTVNNLAYQIKTVNKYLDYLEENLSNFPAKN